MNFTPIRTSDLSEIKNLQPNGDGQTYYLPALGDGTIIASNDEAGKELMKLKYMEASKAVFPNQNSFAIDYLLVNGYVLNESTATRMVRGTNVNWKPKCIFAQIGGNFG